MSLSSMEVKIWSTSARDAFMLISVSQVFIPVPVPDLDPRLEDKGIRKGRFTRDALLEDEDDDDDLSSIKRSASLVPASPRSGKSIEASCLDTIKETGDTLPLLPELTTARSCCCCLMEMLPKLELKSCASFKRIFCFLLDPVRRFDSLTAVLIPVLAVILVMVFVDGTALVLELILAELVLATTFALLLLMASSEGSIWIDFIISVNFPIVLSILFIVSDNPSISFFISF
mmetsp:Transcript_2827/g.4140  ORF Transcript_2827/g.4140 Transcript_2827/m.4140 type:complete len:231 (+) Transcript_2827:687-1379(+)